MKPRFSAFFIAAALVPLLAASCSTKEESFFGEPPVLRSGGGAPDAGGGAGGVGGAATAGAAGSQDDAGSAGVGGSAGSGGGEEDAGVADGGLSPRSGPSVDAGPDLETIVGQSVQLDGLSVSDPDDEVILVSWDVVSAPAGSLATVSQPDGGSAEFTPDVAGTYTLHVTASDGSDNATDTLRVAACEAVVDAFPVPLAVETSIFSDLDDDSVEIPFGAGFGFLFYGVSYDSLHLNTNGGITFGAGNELSDQAANDVLDPTIAPFWSDHDVRQSPGPDRADQLRYQQCPDRFVLTYEEFQEVEGPNTDDSATVTLQRDGTIVIEYGAVGAASILAGIFDGSHANDERPNPGGENALVQSTYDDYASSGTGIILTDHFGEGPTHAGELTDRTITFNP